MAKHHVPPHETVSVPAAAVTLAGDLALPPGARGIALFAHASGSSRLSPRNRLVARVLNEAGIGTLLIDLLTAEEEVADSSTARLRFDVDLLTARLLRAAEWLACRPGSAELPLGYFGASTGVAAALGAAAARPELASAIVSRGGRPDLARVALQQVVAPTLLIVGGHDAAVLGLNQVAAAEMRCVKRLALIPGATHLFEEPGALEMVAALARDWFARYLVRPEAAAPAGLPEPAQRSPHVDRRGG